MKDKFRKAFNFLKGLFPAHLPQGVAEFDTWVDSLIATYALPTKLKTDVIFICSNEIMRLGPDTYRKSKYYFVRRINAAASKQVAGAVFYETKNKHQQEQAKAQQAAAPALAVVQSEPIKGQSV